MERNVSPSQLAMNGGDPVWTRGWPVWPIGDESTQEAVIDVVKSGRWTISGPATGKRTEEARFSEEFASYLRCAYCVPVDHGTSALILALESVGVCHGSEVIVPGMTWVACAEAVVALGAVPVMVDVDPVTMCLDPQLVAEAITDRTSAIMCVHLYCSVADIGVLSELARVHDLPIIEDCAQAHGAIWRGSFVGTIGRVGTFSMQQGKPLTSGEGGCCVTDDPGIAERIYLMRTNGRRLKTGGIPLGQMDLEEIGGAFGRNACISEFQCAILRAQLGRLDEQIERRRSAVRFLERRLAEFDWVRTPKPAPGTDRISVYHWVTMLDRSAFSHRSIEKIAEAVSAELGAWVHPCYTPLSRNRLYTPLASPLARQDPELARRLDPRRVSLPVCEELRANCLAFHHPMLLAEEDGLRAVISALCKVQRESDKIPMD